MLLLSLPCTRVSRLRVERRDAAAATHSDTCQAREKQLEEARRLAALQKRRGLGRVWGTGTAPSSAVLGALVPFLLPVGAPKTDQLRAGAQGGRHQHLKEALILVAFGKCWASHVHATSHACLSRAPETILSARCQRFKALLKAGACAGTSPGNTSTMERKCRSRHCHFHLLACAGTLGGVYQTISFCTQAVPPVGFHEVGPEDIFCKLCCLFALIWPGRSREHIGQLTWLVDPGTGASNLHLPAKS